MGVTALQRQLSENGKKGGPARAAALSKERRIEIARMGGAASAKKRKAKK